MSADGSGGRAGGPSGSEGDLSRSGVVPQANDIVRLRNHPGKGYPGPGPGPGPSGANPADPDTADPDSDGLGLGLIGPGLGRLGLGPSGPGPGRLGLGLIVLAVALLAAVGLTGPNLARPDLGPRGWAPGSLPWTLGPSTVTLVLAGAHLAGVLGVALALRSRVTLRLSPGVVGLLAVLALAVAPFGSADHVNYAAYGRILLGGGDPYTQSPIAWAGGTDPVTSRVEAPWTTTPSVYGPVATAFHGLAALVGGDDLRQVVWVWQAVLVLGWLGTRVLLRRLAVDDLGRSRVDLLWTLNPIVLGVGLLGAHVDVLAAALAVAALAVGAGSARLAWLAGVLVALTASTKITYGAVGAGLLWAWWRLDQTARVRRAATSLAAFAVTAVVVHLPFGSHVYDQVDQARRSISLATPWRPVYELLRGPLGGSTTRTVVFVVAAVLMVFLAALILRLTRHLVPDDLLGEATRVTFALATAYVLLAPYSLPWYELLTWALLPLLAPSALDLVLLGRGAVMAVAYVPGRVLGLELAWPARMLWWRKVVGPIAGVAALVVTAVSALRRPAPRRRASRP